MRYIFNRKYAIYDLKYTIDTILVINIYRYKNVLQLIEYSMYIYINFLILIIFLNRIYILLYIYKYLFFVYIYLYIL